MRARRGKGRLEERRKIETKACPGGRRPCPLTFGSCALSASNRSATCLSRGTRTVTDAVSSWRALWNATRCVTSRSSSGSGRSTTS